MKLSKSLLLIPAASFLVAAAVGAGACSSSVTFTTADEGDVGVAPVGFVAPDGIIIGSTACTGDVYIDSTDGNLFCFDGLWEYTTDDPADFTNYSSYTGSGDDDDTGSDDTGSDDTGSDDTGSDDTGSDDTGSDDAAGDDTGSGDDTGAGDDTGSGDDAGGGGDDAGSDDAG